MVYNLADHSALERNLSQNFDEDNFCCGSIQFLIHFAGSFFLRMIQRNERLIWIKFVLLVIIHIVVFYTDLVKDVYFVIIYSNFIDASVSFRSLKFQVLLLLIFSIVITFALNFILIAREIYKLFPNRKNRLLNLFCALIASPFCPGTNTINPFSHN